MLHRCVCVCCLCTRLHIIYISVCEHVSRGCFSSLVLQDDSQQLGYKASGRLTDGVVGRQFLLQTGHLHVIPVEEEHAKTSRTLKGCITA